ncbi:hypothetical protein BZA77DRAFT_323052 [Pyronema omphalodes]|nr:hypothetical protein BZA77DRAFT_323052 [Pyronema omphalodes]
MNNARANGVGPIASQSPSAVNGIHQQGPILASQQNMMSAPLVQNGQPAQSYLMLLPLNATFERKQIPLPTYPETLRIGRQTNAKTIPTPTNGYFDSKVLSRQHAEVWAHDGKVWIRDIKSSNGTFVNGQRLSQENQDSEPHRLQTEDILELGIDIVGEDNKTIVHHKVAARVEHAGTHVGGADFNFGEIDSLMSGLPITPGHPQSQPGSLRGRNNGASRPSLPNGAAPGPPRQQPFTLSGSSTIAVEQIVKRLNIELFAAKQQSQDLQRTTEVFDILLSAAPKSQSQPEAQNTQSHELSNGLSKTFSLPQKHDDDDPDRDGTSSPDALSSGKSSSKSYSSVDTPQVLTLVGELARAKKEMELNNARILSLESALNKEKQLREAAESRATQLEEVTEMLKENLREQSRSSEMEKESLQVPVASSTSTASSTASMNEGDQKTIADAAAESATALQKRMEEILAELKAAKSEMLAYKIRAEAAESERDHNQKTLAETIRAIRKADDERKEKSREKSCQTNPLEMMDEGTMTIDRSRRSSTQGNIPELLRKDSGLAVQLAAKEQALILSRQSASPYAAMLGVVLLGVGLMAVINNWQRGER